MWLLNALKIVLVSSFLVEVRLRKKLAGESLLRRYLPFGYPIILIGSAINDLFWTPSCHEIGIKCSSLPLNHCWHYKD